MKSKSITSILAAALLAPGALFATTATTIPVGYISLGNTAGTALPDNTDITMSVPLYKEPHTAGLVDTVTGNDIELQGTPGFTINQFSSAEPYFLEITSGAKNGLIAVITANTADTLTLSLQPGDSLAGVVSSDTIIIRKANTLANTFAGNTLPDGVELLVWNNGTVAGDNLANDTSFIYFGGQWFDSGFVVADNAVLYPGESYVMRNATGTDVTSLVISGEVPVSKHRNVISKLAPAVAQDTRFAHTNPVSEPIGSSGYGFGDGDELVVFDNVSTGLNKAGTSYFFFGGIWFDGGFNDVSTTFFLKGGEGYVYRRVALDPVGDSIVSDTISN